MKSLAAILLCAIAVLADTYPRQPGIDAQHYIFRVTLSDYTDEIAGEVTVVLRFVRDGVREFALDLASPRDGRGMTVAGVTSGTAVLSYRHQADRLVIALPDAAKAGEIRDFTVKYQGVPGNGLKIGKNKYGERTFFSVNWPTMARQWLPTIDHPYDKATSEFLVTAPAAYQVVANGVLVETVDLGDRRLTHWKQSVPIASWLNNIGVARFASRQFGTAAGVPLQTWVFHQDRDNGIVTFETPTRQAMEFYTSHIGPYPYEKLADVQAAGMGGGMEHASEIFYGENTVGAKPATSLVAHEISHQWFGDSVTEKDWDDAWLSEGFATYFALLCSEHYEGRDAFVAGLKHSRATILGAEKRAATPVVHDNLPEIRNGRAPNILVYQKGAWTLHMLRAQVGTDIFWQAIREYYRRYRDSNASTADLRQVFEETSGSDLRWFFDQWLYRAGSPAIRGGWRYDAAAKKIDIDLAQTQPGEPYRLPIEVGIAGKVEKIEFTQKQQRFEIAAETEPESIAFDPNTWLLADVDFQTTSAAARASSGSR
ncbi:MAG TPA: M1 family metallopeptidase [Bryobacteraceae bacterium]|jgi:aminopeptidase N